MQIAIKQVSGLQAALDSKASGNYTLSAGTGLSITAGGVISSNPTLSLSGLVGALAGISSNGFLGVNGSSLAAYTLASSAGTISITNGAGGGAPNLDLPSNICAPGTYHQVTIDEYGRATAGANPTTFSGYGITDALSAGGGTITGPFLFSGGSFGTNPPSLTTRSNGTRLSLNNTLSSSAAEIAIGTTATSMWFSTSSNDTGHGFTWYGGTTSIATLDGTGNLILSGTLTATQKSFEIPHPIKPDMRLRHGSLEGPENAVYFRGKGRSKSIRLPDYWIGLVDYSSITIHITSNDGLIYSAKMKANYISVSANDEGYSPYDYTFLVIATRKDIPPLIVES